MREVHQSWFLAATQNCLESRCSKKHGELYGCFEEAASSAEAPGFGFDKTILLVYVS